MWWVSTISSNYCWPDYAMRPSRRVALVVESLLVGSWTECIVLLTGCGSKWAMVVSVLVVSVGVLVWRWLPDGSSWVELRVRVDSSRVGHHSLRSQHCSWGHDTVVVLELTAQDGPWQLNPHAMGKGVLSLLVTCLVCPLLKHSQVRILCIGHTGTHSTLKPSL